MLEVNSLSLAVSLGAGGFGRFCCGRGMIGGIDAELGM